MENEKGEMKNEIEKMYIVRGSRCIYAVRELIWSCPDEPGPGLRGRSGQYGSRSI